MDGAMMPTDDDDDENGDENGFTQGGAATFPIPEKYIPRS